MRYRLLCQPPAPRLPMPRLLAQLRQSLPFLHLCLHPLPR
jgi:hypothetical protein